MRNAFNKFYKPVLLALTALTLAVCAFFAVFLGVNNNPGGGQLEVDTQITAETVDDADNKTSAMIPSLFSNATLTYNGREQDIRFNFNSQTARLTELIYMTISDSAQTVLYRYENGAVTDGSYPLVNTYVLKATNAGVYTARFELPNTTDYYWGNNVTDIAPRYVTGTINQARSVVNFTVAPAPYFTDDTELPEITLDTATSTPGTLKWDEGQAPLTEPGTINAKWVFTPTDQINYSHETDEYPLTYQIDVIETVNIAWKDAEDTKIYTTTSESDFKSKITVTGTYTSGKTVEVIDYTFEGGTDAWKNPGIRYIVVNVLNGDGEGTIVSNDPGFEITVLSRTATKITYELNHEGAYKANVAFDDIKQNDLVVTAYYDDGNNEVLAPDEYTLKNKDGEHPDEFFGAGHYTLVISYQNRTAEFEVDVELAEYAFNVTFDEINAVYGDEYTVAVTGDIPEGVTVTYRYSGLSSDGVTQYPETEDKPIGAGVYTVTAVFIVDESKYENIESLETTLTIAKAYVQLSEIEISGWTYGEAVSTPTVTALAGSIPITDISITYYSDAELNEQITAPTSLLDCGTYYVKAEVHESRNFFGADTFVSFTITKRAITVTINQAKSYKGEDIATFTATVTEGTIAEGNTESEVYSLSTTADKDVAGIYSISGEELSQNYEIIFVGGTDAYWICQSISVADGSLLGGQVDIPAEGEYTLVVTAVGEDRVYEDLVGDINIRGFIATLYKTEDGEQVAVTGVPTIVRLAVPNGMKDYKLYAVDGEGATHETEFNTAADGFIEIVYVGAFPMEFVFTAPIIRGLGLPWWVWLIVALAVVAIVAIIAELATKNKRPARDDTAIIVAQIYNDAEVRRILAEHGKRIEDLIDIDDDGFNDPYEGGYNFG